MSGWIEAWNQAQQANMAHFQTLAPWVHDWMAVMTGAIQASLLFVLWRAEARWVFAVGILTPASATLFRMVIGEDYLPGFNHVILWTPLVIYIGYRMALRIAGDEHAAAETQQTARCGRLRRIYHAVDRHPVFRRLYDAWLIAILAILLVSLGFDLREALNILAIGAQHG